MQEVIRLMHDAKETSSSANKSDSNRRRNLLAYS